jgi:TIR domain
MTAATYGIYVIQQHRQAWLDALTTAIAQELEDVGLHRTLDVQLSESPFDDAIPSLGLFLAGYPEIDSGDLRTRVADAQMAGTPVIPVVEDLAAFGAAVPASLQPINGFEFAGFEPAQRLARLLLEELGIEDQQRRVFISHRRIDGLAAAEQLHDELTHRRFLPFIDRFAIREGQDVEDIIVDELEQHAFLLLLETPQAHGSPWVFDEIEYALSHTMGIAIITWPDEPKPVPGSHRLPRERLATADLYSDSHGYDVLTDSALERVVLGVEAAHADGIVRRRRMLTQSIEDAARAAGCECLPQRSWRLRVEQGGAATLVGVTPRLPAADDLQALDEARTSEDMLLLVHGARRLRPRLQRHLEWVTGDREITLKPENAIGAHWK